MNGDPEAISNHSLHAKLMTLEAKFEAHGRQLDDHVGRAAEFHRDTRNSLRAIDGRLGKAEIRFALIEQGIADTAKLLGTIDTKLDTLIADDNQRKGRDGFIKGVLNSKVLAWLIAAAGAIWAVITGTGQGGGS